MRSNSRQSQVGRRKAKGKSIVVVCLLVPALYVASGFLTVAGARQYTFEEVASGLKHSDPATRARAIQILKDADYPEATAPIGEALGDVDDRVQLAAIDAERSLFMLRPISRKKMVGFVIEQRTSTGDVATEGVLALKVRPVPPQVLSGLVLALSDQNPQVRLEAVGLAALLGPVACRVGLGPDTAFADPRCAQVGNALIENINSRETAVRRSAMQALGRLRYPQAVQALSDQFSYYQTGADADAALEGLAGIGHGSSVSFFEDALASSNADRRRLGVEGLARAGHRDALATLQQMAESDRSSGVLLALHYANLTLGAPGGSVPQLVASVRDSALRPLALRYLLDLAPANAAVLTESLRHSDVDVRRLVADVLGFSGDPSVVPALDEVASDVNPDVTLAAQRAIERIRMSSAARVAPRR